MATRKSLSSKSGGYLKSVILMRDRVESLDRYPFNIPAIRKIGTLPLDPRVTFLIGENGSGKSTLIEAIAVNAGFNAEGGSKNIRFATKSTESDLCNAIVVARGVARERDGYFLRAESLYNLATEIENLEAERHGLIDSYGGKSLHDQSHGESFVALATNRLRGNGLYIMDEPEAALSPNRQIAFLKIIHQLAQASSQLVIATHLPILLAYPKALIYHLGPDGIAKIASEDTEHYRVTLDFLSNREANFHHLF